MYVVNVPAFCGQPELTATPQKRSVLCSVSSRKLKTGQLLPTSLAARRILFLALLVLFCCRTLIGTARFTRKELIVIPWTAFRLDRKATIEYRVWTYPVKPPELLIQSTNREAVYLCAYKSCRDALIELDNKIESINLGELTKSVTLPPSYRRFVRDQYWFKVLHGLNFPHHVQLLAIWSILAACDGCCVSTISFSKSLCSYDLEVSEKISTYDPTKTQNLSSAYEQLIPLKNLSFPVKYGILDFDRRVTRLSGKANSGDEIQTFAGLQFLPYLSDYVDRENGLPTSDVNMFCNAWWGTKVAFPGHTNANLTFTSVHMSAGFLSVAERNKEYFQDYASKVGPIGARDFPTLHFLRKISIPAYFSNCMTQMIQTYNEEGAPKSDIVVVDTDPSVLPKYIRDTAIYFGANVPEVMYIPGDSHASRMNRLEYAHHLMYIYTTKTKVLITSRIHAALPASAQGVPVIFVESEELPGGGGGRHIGISELFHTYRPKDGTWPFGDLQGNVSHLHPNPKVHKQDRYRASFWHYLRTKVDKNHQYADSARLLGTVPLQRLGRMIFSTHKDEEDLFHFIFTTPSDTLTWRIQRAIETVFYHHPNAKVMMHSQTLPAQGTVLDCFAEAGYNFGIYNYSFFELLNESPSFSPNITNHFLAMIPWLRKQKFWYSHETDWLRMLIMQRYGGVYMDTDMYLIQPLKKSMRNMIGWEDWKKEQVNGAIMIFHANSTFISRCLQNSIKIFMQGYNPNHWVTYGPGVLTKTYHQLKENRNIISAVNPDHFYPFHYSNVERECFKSRIETRVIPNITFSVHLNTKLTKEIKSILRGSTCDQIFSKYCIFCDDILEPVQSGDELTMPAFNPFL